MECLFSVVGKMAEYTVEPVGRQLGYVCFISNNIQNLEKHVEELRETKESVQQKISVAERNIEDIKPNVKNWLSKVDDTIEKCEAIFHEGQRVRLCSNLIKRHKLSRKAVKMVDEVVEIKDKGNFEQVSYNASLSEYESTIGKGSEFLYFESRNLVMKQIMDAFSDNNINKIGVHGMGGAGKTMLVDEISREVMVNKSFNEVIKVIASQTIEPKEIQTQIAEKLNLNLTDTTVGIRALKLHKRLKYEKKILIVIDDLWKKVDLDEIGIPSVADHTGCKILITSRDSNIFNSMCTNKIFKINDLQEDEAWNLFMKFAGEIDETSDLKLLGVQIVEKCARLPIVITTVAKALKRDKSSSNWIDFLNQLRNSSVMAVKMEGMEKDVYFPLKLSYERLEWEDEKLLFLLCSMFPQHYSIDVEDLHVYAMSLSFLQGVHTIAQGRHRIKRLVKILISSSLLLPSESEDNHVKMHDIIRDVAISIASTNDRIRTLCYTDEELNNEWEEEKIMSGNPTAVYLNFRDLRGPPQKWMLPKVQLLRLVNQQSYFVTLELAETFFEETKELKVLDLKGFKISLLSPSLYSANFISLHLSDCALENIDMIAELKNLKILKLGGPNVVHIPTAMSQLTQLRVLNLSFCDSLEVISPNVLSSLTKLEELYLKTFRGWEGEEVLNQGRKNASLFELKYLQQLSTLELWIPDEKIMPKQLFSKKLNFDRFNITIGRRRERSKYMNTFFKVLFLEMKSGSCKDDWIKMLLKKSEELCLIGSIGAWILGSELDENESSNVQHLYIHNISELQHLIHDEHKNPSRKALSNLRFLQLNNLKNLESIVHGHVREPHLEKLTVVQVKKCNKLRSLFFNCTVEDLLNLEKIKISDCETLDVITVLRSEEANQNIEFAHLNYLKLKNLPQLENFCSNQPVRTSNFSDADSFFSEQVSLPNLETLVIARVNLKMIYPDKPIPNSFSKLKRVEINSCKELKYVFPSYIGSIFTCLKILEVSNCDLLQGIFEGKGPWMENVVSLLNLSVLKLFNLPNLEYLWSKKSCDFLIEENTRVLSIHRCPKLTKTHLVKFYKKVEDLRIDFNDLKQILMEEKLVQDHFEISEGEAGRLELFSKLKSLNICCDSPDYKSTHFPMEIVRIFDKLEDFHMSGLSIEEIFPAKRLIIDVEEEHQNNNTPSLQVLNSPC